MNEKHLKELRNEITQLIQGEYDEDLLKSLDYIDVAIIWYGSRDYLSELQSEVDKWAYPEEGKLSRKHIEKAEKDFKEYLNRYFSISNYFFSLNKTFNIEEIEAAYSGYCDWFPSTTNKGE